MGPEAVTGVSVGGAELRIQMWLLSMPDNFGSGCPASQFCLSGFSAVPIHVPIQDSPLSLSAFFPWCTTDLPALACMLAAP